MTCTSLRLTVTGHETAKLCLGLPAEPQKGRYFAPLRLPTCSIETDLDRGYYCKWLFYDCFVVFSDNREYECMRAITNICVTILVLLIFASAGMADNKIRSLCYISYPGYSAHDKKVYKNNYHPLTQPYLQGAQTLCRWVVDQRERSPASSLK
jgi:hypothetical protein